MPLSASGIRTACARLTPRANPYRLENPMFKRVSVLLFGLSFAALAQAADTFEAGTHWFPVEPPQATSTGDKVEVVEVFSYACPACNFFQPTMHQLQKALPANAELTFLPASFRADENWPEFQRAYYTAQALGLLDKTHDAMFDAIWKDDGKLRISDPATHRPLEKMPTTADVAAFFANYGVSAEDAIGTANSFAVNAKMKRADGLLKAYGVDSTPTLVVNGKYRFTAKSAGGVDKVVPLALFLIAKESAAN
jgi:protein dithiol oxidoreductase (disulfide-forming)